MSEQHPRTSLYGTEERTLFCPTLKREYHLSVSLPDSYGTSTQSYPVVYVLDGDLLFGMAAGLTRFSTVFKGIPELIVVGISYGDLENLDQWVELRDHNYNLPELPEAPPDSVGELFLAALTQEMIPFIEANYRALSSDRCLYGYSASGFFVLYALSQQPDAFQHYISGSGSLADAYLYVSQHDAQLAAHKTDKPSQLYLSVGELEDFQFPFFDQLVDQLKQGNYPGLNVQSEIYPGEGHGAEGMALSYFRGLSKVYTQHNAES
jgi:predicted alpha/beta superfamily hydrolase